jgi:predicted nucleic acid-binding protein
LRATLVDSNVIIDYLDPDSEWADWSAAMLTEAANDGAVAINPVIYAEVSVTYPAIETVETALPRAYFERAQLPWEAAFLAGKCFEQYRRSGGTKRSPLPDFYIGAHAAIGRLALLTRDAARYRSYFPRVEILAPTKRGT